MADEETRNPEVEETGLTVVPVPADKAQAVIEFVAGLERPEDEVSGHMISGAFGGLVGGFGGRLAEHTRTDTSCTRTTTGGTGDVIDFRCTDSDTVYT